MTSGLMPLPDPVYVVVGGARVATYAFTPERPSSMRDVVFCHGTPWSAQIWAEVAVAVSDGRRVLLWDMPGYGRSTMDSQAKVDLPSQMARLAELIVQWGSDRPYIVAHDIGGAVALGAHMFHGSDYSGMFLWDTVVLDPWGSPFFRLVAAHADVFTQLPPTLHAALVREYIAGASGDRLEDDVIAALSGPWISVEGQFAFYRQIASLHPDDTRPISERLRDVRCEVAIGWGAQDQWIPVEQAHRLRNRLPTARSLFVLDGVGHLAPIEAPEQVAARVAEWLAGSS